MTAVADSSRAARLPGPRRDPAILARLARAAGWAAVTVAVVALLVATAVPLALGMRPLVVAGTSMTGSIPIGSLALAEPVDAAAVQVGDVITYDHPMHGASVRVTHRVTKVERPDGVPTFHTKGDANAGADPWRVQYVDGPAWRVVAHVPHAGSVIAQLQSPGARIALVIVPLGVLLVGVLHSIWAHPARPAARQGGASRS